jgi:hypothetical protein
MKVLQCQDCSTCCYGMQQQQHGKNTMILQEQANAYDHKQNIWMLEAEDRFSESEQLQRISMTVVSNPSLSVYLLYTGLDMLTRVILGPKIQLPILLAILTCLHPQRESLASPLQTAFQGPELRRVKHLSSRRPA